MRVGETRTGEITRAMQEGFSTFTFACERDNSWSWRHGRPGRGKGEKRIQHGLESGSNEKEQGTWRLQRINSYARGPTKTTGRWRERENGDGLMADGWRPAPCETMEETAGYICTLEWEKVEREPITIAARVKAAATEENTHTGFKSIRFLSHNSWERWFDQVCSSVLDSWMKLQI